MSYIFKGVSPFWGNSTKYFFVFWWKRLIYPNSQQSSWVESWISISRFNSSQGFVWTTSLLWGIWHFHFQLIEWGWWVWKPGWWEGWGCIRASKQRRHCGRCTPALSCIKFNTHNNSKRFWLVVITCSKKAPKRVRVSTSSCRVFADYFKTSHTDKFVFSQESRNQKWMKIYPILSPK